MCFIPFYKMFLYGSLISFALIQIYWCFAWKYFPVFLHQKEICEEKSIFGRKICVCHQVKYSLRISTLPFCIPKRCRDNDEFVLEIWEIHCSRKWPLFFFFFTWGFLQLAWRNILDCWHCPKCSFDKVSGIFINSSSSENVNTALPLVSSEKQEGEVPRTKLRCCFLQFSRFAFFITRLCDFNLFK